MNRRKLEEHSAESMPQTVTGFTLAHATVQNIWLSCTSSLRANLLTDKETRQQMWADNILHCGSHSSHDMSDVSENMSEQLSKLILLMHLGSCPH